MKRGIPKGFVSVALPAMILVILSSCTATRSLGPDEYLLVKNKIEYAKENPGIKTDDLFSIARPKPNQKFLGLVRIKLYAYSQGIKGRQDSKFKTWLRDKAGERPSVYDSAIALESAEEMKLYLNKTGYFNSTIRFHTRKIRKRKIHVIYEVTPSISYRYNSVLYNLDDTLIQHYVDNSKTPSDIGPGAVYNAFSLDDERDRITAILQNNGYYYFNRDYIYFEVDSTIGNRMMDLTVKLKPNLVNSADELRRSISVPHKRFFIRDVYIRPDFDPLIPRDIKLDTILYHSDATISAGKKAPGNYYFIQPDSEKIHPKTVIQSIFIKPGDPFRQTDISRSRSRINEIGAFSYTNIRFRPLPAADSALTGQLDCTIDLSRKELHAFTVETEVTNSGGRPGVGLNFTYSNSNIFRGSETLRLKARGALEAQQIFGKEAEYVESTPFFNTIETGFEMSVIFPRFLMPINQERFPRYFRPKTTISLGIGYESRPEYGRWLTNFSFGYDWKESERKRHQIFPLDWSVVNVTLSPEFEQELEDEPNDRIKNQYTDNLITAIRYSFTYNTQDIRKIENFFFFRGNLETAGNILNLGSNVFNARQDSLGQYILFGIPFTQYVKIDGDFRFFNVITRNNSVAYRFFLGAGLPYGNAGVLPLEKGYYGGGANGMRGWPYRLLGPGAYSSSDDYFDRMGDIQLELNLEIRFPIYNFLKGALFTDIGNIWLMNEDESYPGGEFRFDRFYQEFAIDIGLGTRFDFNFFIMRVDFAIPLCDPAMPQGDRWVADQWQFKDFIINFGIGYPF